MFKYRLSNGQQFDIPYSVQKGLDGKDYYVFDGEYEAEDFLTDVVGEGNGYMCCFGGFLNAVYIYGKEESVNGRT